MDRRVISAVVLMMAIAMLPALIFRRPPPAPRADSVAVAAAPEVTTAPAAPVVPAPSPAADTATAPARTVEVVSPLFTYGVSTRGARLVEARLHEYRSMAPGEASQDADILRPGSDLLGLQLVVGGDTLSIRDWEFTPSAESVTAAPGSSLVLTASRGALTVELRYGFRPDNYLVTADGRITGLGPNGGTLLIGMGPGLRNVEVDSVEHMRNLAVVTKSDESRRTDFGGLTREGPTDLSGPFEWVAVKSKYFVAAVFALDTVSSGRAAGQIGGVRVVPIDTRKRPAEADVRATLPVASAGAFRYTLYAGPMEYPRLRAMGHDFYDVNPYGWPGFRTIIRPVAVAARWLLVWMYDRGIAYGLGLILFGIMVRVLLWPLNQKAMRASMQMQVIQPILKDLQDRHKDDPARLQQEMFKVYKEYNVNPLGGCWPMLLPMPVLFALFFVFQNTIELRGAPFLWISDLSRADPLFIIPVAMGLSMYLVSKIGQLGMEPNPQMKMMLYLMPVMMTVLFLNFASGLNLYYAVQNLASIPQQWLIAKERVKKNPSRPAEGAKPPGKREKGEVRSKK